MKSISYTTSVLHLLCLFSAILFGVCEESTGKQPLVRILEPPRDHVYQSPEAYITIEAENFEVGKDGPACFLILWDKGQQDFCADGLAQFVISGLEAGGYALFTTLVKGDRDGEVVAENFQTFSVELESHEPRVKITYPERDSIITTPTIEVFFVVAYPQDDIVVCLSANDFKIGRTCFENNHHYWTIQAKEPGRVRIQAKLFHRNGTEVAGRQTHSSVEFDVDPIDPTLTSGLMDLYAEIGYEEVKTQEIEAKSGAKPMAAGISEQVHMAVISARSVERYEEALVMLKSALFHWGKRTADQYKGMHLHMIVDPGGKKFFSEILVAEELPRVSISFYDFHSTCTEPVDNFLAKFKLDISAHYSGRAGYCRLFLPAIFPDLDAVMAIESDQLFFEDPGLLWNQFFTFPDQAVLGAPELYRQWQDSRPYAEKFKEQKLQAMPSEFHLDADDHGFGIIGGIMLFNLTRMKEHNWEDVWHQNFAQFLKHQEEGWMPTLNDQDVFNAVLAISPHLGTILPCEWNLQYHAYMNSVRVCGRDTLNCQAALDQGIFVCPRHPNVVHFMAGSYKGSSQYYNSFWPVYKDLPFFLIKEVLSYDHRKAVSSPPSQ
mmetsp:Transcript_24726/g.32284  ORF Transcript_24726/g.32284 Transcript_24726/m.32284 type:complete len:604 (-) Transcript_24726:168-1979(-)